MKELVGKTITGVYQSQCNKYIGFKTTDSMIVYKAINGCKFSFNEDWGNTSIKINFVGKYFNSYKQVTHLYLIHDGIFPTKIILENDNNKQGGDFKLIDLVDYKCSFDQLREYILSMKAMGYGIYNTISIKEGDLEIELLQAKR